jgi:Mg-chelatase subunit ChlD
MKLKIFKEKFMLKIILLISLSLGLFAEDLTLRKNVLIIFDDSGSMNSGGFFSNTRITRAKKAITSVLSNLDETYNVGIITLNKGYIYPLEPLNKINAIRVVKKLRADGGTNLTRAIKKGSDVLEQQRKKQAGYGFYNMIIVTDGAADNNRKMLKEVDSAISKGITIQTVGLDISRHKLKSVTKFTEASSVSELTQAISKAINSEISLDSKFEVQDF